MQDKSKKYVKNWTETESHGTSVASSQKNNGLNIKLRKVRESDLMQIAKWRVSPEVTKYMYTDPVLTYEDQLKWFGKIKSDKTCKYWIIECESQGKSKSIGVFSAIDIDNKNYRCNRQWYIGDAGLIGKGIGKVIQLNFNDYCFDKLNINRQYCEVLADNKRAIEVNLKLGFNLEGVMEEHVLKNGKYLDVVIMAITKGKWESIKRSFDYPKIEIED